MTTAPSVTIVDHPRHLTYLSSTTTTTIDANTAAKSALDLTRTLVSLFPPPPTSSPDSSPITPGLHTPNHQGSNKTPPITSSVNARRSPPSTPPKRPPRLTPIRRAPMPTTPSSTGQHNNISPSVSKMPARTPKPTHILSISDAGRGEPEPESLNNFVKEVDRWIDDIRSKVQALEERHQNWMGVHVHRISTAVDR